ncbi:MAG TPA: DUF2293 domain-containing protein [Bacteroidetes bacterium]|nr:DUF2293 domain-containing protein [Bacteroidota bacterium]
MAKKKNHELTVFITSHETTCSECGAELDRKVWITLDEKKGALCLACADLDHLWFLPSGDAALTRRTKKYSTLSAVVLKFSRARKRYERQGLLVEGEALERAEQECLADSDIRQRRNERAAVRRSELDREYVEKFVAKIREQYPGLPKGREIKIAEHACRKYSGRIGRTAEAKIFSQQAVKLAVIAHIRHTETEYDTLLSHGYDRYEARAMVEKDVLETLVKWQE